MTINEKANTISRHEQIFVEKTIPEKDEDLKKSDKAVLKARYVNRYVWNR